MILDYIIDHNADFVTFTKTWLRANDKIIVNLLMLFLMDTLLNMELDLDGRLMVAFSLLFRKNIYES